MVIMVVMGVVIATIPGVVRRFSLNWETGIGKTLANLDICIGSKEFRTASRRDVGWGNKGLQMR
jgi:hypothetical protein